jgi:AraC-like DNA-binding protein
MQKIRLIHPPLSLHLAAVVLAGIMVVGALMIPLFAIKKIDLQRYTFSAYDDRTEKEPPGNSEILSVSNDSSMLKLSYILRKGYPYPYAGITIPFGDSSSQFLDCASFNAVKIRISSSKLSDSKLYLRVYDRNISQKNNPLSERYLYRELEVGSTPQEITVPLRELITPDWWFQKNNITQSDAAPVDFSQVTALQFESGATAKTGIVDTITVSGIWFVKKPDTVLIGILAGIFIIMTVLLLIRVLPAPKKHPSIVITYDKKELHNYRDLDAKRISEYVAEHYSEPALSILTAGTSLGLSQKKIARIMNEEFTMSFKQYLTSIRVHEAKRLLKETDRLVFDIALAVGFNSISHFNRVFKTAMQVSPMEFRNKPGSDGN